MVSESVTNLDFRDPKFDQAQIEINVLTSRNISDIKLQLIKSFQMKETTELKVTGCVILPNGNLLLANNTRENKLIMYSDTGKHIRDIQVSGKPFDIAVIDLDRIVVTYGDESYIEIMNSNTFNVEKKISLQNSCLGISHEDGKLFMANGNGIQVIGLSGKEMKTLKEVSKGIFYIKSTRDKIFYTDVNTQKIHCCHLNGKELWQRKIDSIVFPLGITLDNYHNVYVVGYSSNNLTTIQPDGKDSKTLLAESDGLMLPQTVCYDNVKGTLIICSDGNNVALYKVVQNLS
ncbi:uncharacterized protein [Mytilus edulis]|uniref:uncharacterized protein n=1 Tax=Mytilus edulis TaxID=6550 RepID=UPI0039EEF031